MQVPTRTRFIADTLAGACEKSIPSFSCRWGCDHRHAMSRSRPGERGRECTNDVRCQGPTDRMPAKQEVSNFIRANFRSVWALELLCFLRQHRDRSLSHAEMVTGLRGSDLVVTQSLESLTIAGLIVVEEDGSARYSPASPDLDRMIERTEALYAKSPDAVRRMIVSAAAPGITAFADAFKLRGD